MPRTTTSVPSHTLALARHQHARHQQCAVALDSHRQRFRTEITAAQRRSARAFWAEQRLDWLRSDPFVRLPKDHHLRQMLDELPHLRRQVRPKKVLAALVEEWREAHADELGLPAQLHYHVLARRGQERARQTAAWFNARAPSYTSVAHIADSALAALVAHAATLPAPAGIQSAN